MAKFKLLVTLIAGLSFSLPATAKMYKWVDDHGTTHYSETIPPEYANKDRAELGKSGRVIKKEVMLTPDQRREKEAADARQRGEEEAAKEQKRRDRALLSTYSSVGEIDLARDRNLQQVQTRINSISSQIKRVSDELLALNKEANLTRSNGKIIPPSLKEDLQGSQARLDKLKLELEKTQAEKNAVEARYVADKARYRELTGK